MRMLTFSQALSPRWQPAAIGMTDYRHRHEGVRKVVIVYRRRRERIDINPLAWKGYRRNPSSFSLSST
ncbi:MAG: hypothetical protein SOZ58_08040 [Prevotella sp.]|nr:hypothetical protein [Prevotella sp.]